MRRGNTQTALHFLFSGFLIAAGVCSFGSQAFAYAENGLLVSTNLLSGEGVGARRIVSFTYTASSIPANTSLRISFSRTGSGTAWYSSSGSLYGWDTLSQGTQTIYFNDSDWKSTSKFYYKVSFLSDGVDTPVLDAVQLTFDSLINQYDTYYSTGSLVSTNLLSGEYAASIDNFLATVSVLPSQTSLAVQFSQNGTTWFNAAGSQNGSTALVAAGNTVDLSGLGWSGAAFYYRVNFTSSGSNTAVLDDIALSFTVDTTPPAAPGTPDLQAASDTGSGSTDNLTNDTTPSFTISCESSAIVAIFSGSTSLGSGTCASSTVSITSSALTTDGIYQIKAKQTDAAGNVSATGSALAVTLDATAPTASTLSPLDDATDIAITTNLVLTFSEAISKAGTGTLTIKKSSDDSVVEIVAVTSSQVTGSGTTQITIDPSVTLDYGTAYNIRISSSAFPDAAGNSFAGISTATVWNFTTVAAPSTGGTGNNRARQRNAEAASGGGGGGGGGSVSTGTGATPFVFVPNYAPLATRLTEAQRKAREGSLALPTETARKILEIREALLARFQMQLSDARKREEEREAAKAAFLEQDALATTEERRFARAQQLAQEKGSDRLSSPGKVAERRGLLSMVLGTQAVIYRDVSVTAWFAPYVSLLIEEDIAQGYKDDAGELTGEFGVANAVTLAEALKMAVEAAGIDVEQPLAPPRNPSAVGTWASAYVAIAEDRGISVFTPETDVHRSATRGEVIAILLQATGVPVGSSVQVTGDFSDLPSDHPHAAAITVATFYGLISGDDGKNTVRPDDFINRAEVSKIVALVRELMR